MTRTVGTKHRTEFILDPTEAWHRGRKLDQMLAAASLPVPRGVLRAFHRVFNQMDDQRQLAQARLVNDPSNKTPAVKP